MQAYKKIKALGTELEFYLQSELKRNFDLDFLELEKIVNDFENSFSRFILSSELSLLNRSTDSFWASPTLIDILQTAHKFYSLTAGIFNPAMLTSLERIGYDRSFDLIDSNDTAEVSPKTNEPVNFDLLTIDIDNNLISKPADLKIDLGGIGKGYLVDLLVKSLNIKGYKNFWISAGGDMYLSGLSEDKKPYQVGVQNPIKLDEDIANITVIGHKLAVATSGIAKRRWHKGSKIYNHVIDPRTGTSIENDLLAVTVISDEAVKADVFAKVVLILGKEQGIEFINQQSNTEALIIDKDLEFTLSKEMNKYLTII